jgi:hypothetical protein
MGCFWNGRRPLGPGGERAPRGRPGAYRAGPPPWAGLRPWRTRNAFGGPSGRQPGRGGFWRRGVPPEQARGETSAGGGRPSPRAVFRRTRPRPVARAAPRLDGTRVVAGGGSRRADGRPEAAAGPAPEAPRLSPGGEAPRPGGRGGDGEAERTSRTGAEAPDGHPRDGAGGWGVAFQPLMDGGASKKIF